MHNIEEMTAKMEELKRNKETLMTWVSNEISNGCQGFDLKGTGEAIDMIKDLSDAEKNCWEAMYYKTVVEAMTSNDDVMGYNNRRMANGQYAPAGRGHMGYRPYVDQEPYIDAYLHDPMRMDMMGYRGDSSRGSGRKSNDGGNSSYYGYRDAKMSYTTTGSQTDKEQMEAKKMEYVKEIAANLAEMWEESDPSMRRRIKEDLRSVMGD